MNTASAYVTPVNPEHVQFLTMLQASLEGYYDIDPPYSVSDFVCHSAQTKTGSSRCKGSTPEMLVYRESETNLDISLFLNPALLSGISEHTFAATWAGERFDEGCLLVEGVSHFLFRVFNAHFERPVSLLDVKIQAGIDKFIFAALDTSCRQSPDELLFRLFADISYHHSLTHEDKSRHELANDLAFGYCQWLSNCFTLNRNNRSLLAEISQLYRINGTARQEHIRRVSMPLRLAS